jgi:hypothetical protein
VDFVDLLVRVEKDAELQRVVSAVFQAKAHPFAVLTLVHEWGSDA